MITQKEIDDAIAYLESFIEVDMDEVHQCGECGTSSANQVDHSEVVKALNVLRGAAQ